MRVLHFSDTHNNRRATDAVIAIAGRYPDTHIAITGDICTYSNRVADSRLDRLPNPHVWIAPGEHDMPVSECFGQLQSVRWRTPIVEVVEDVLVVCLTTMNNGFVIDDISDVPTPSISAQLLASLFLCHHKLCDEEIYKLINWFSPLSRRTPIILCHGHNHGNPGLYAKHYLRVLNGVSLHVSHVYSANTSNRGQKIGTGNLIEVAANSIIIVQPVDINSVGT